MLRAQPDCAVRAKLPTCRVGRVQYAQVRVGDDGSLARRLQNCETLLRAARIRQQPPAQLQGAPHVRIQRQQQHPLRVAERLHAF